MQKRVFLNPRDQGDSASQWFDIEAATKYAEDSYWDGSNSISVATGSQWNHETLYKTATGNWVLCSSSQVEQIRDSYEFIMLVEAVPWLIKNNHDPSDLGLTDLQLKTANKIVADLEV
tara:strand:- start:16329 stop:16682 length:354 start_codon:yes stop_codon:yes gene_type:complete